MKLVTERLYLRTWKKSDIPSIVEMFNDKSINKFIYRAPYPYKRKDALKFSNGYCKQKENKAFAIFRKEDDVLVGAITLKDIDKKLKSAGIGYSLHRKYRNKGYMTEAAKRVLQYGFKTLNLNRIEIRCAKGNKASKKVIKKLGAKKEGVLRDECLVNGKFHDHIVHSILRKEYKDKKTR